MSNFLEQGQVIYVTNGEYSGYRVTGFYRVLRSFKPDEAKAEFIALGGWPKHEKDYQERPTCHWYGSSNEFLKWLVAELYLESCDAEFQEVWCDDDRDGFLFSVG